jgi:hypothetical protein
MTTSSGSHQMVPDTPAHTLDFRHCVGTVDVDIRVAGQYHVSVAPLPHRNRGMTRVGGREIWSTEFAPHETFKLVGDAGKVLFEANGDNHNLANVQHIVALPAGKIWVVPSADLPFSLYLRRKD